MRKLIINDDFLSDVCHKTSARDAKKRVNRMTACPEEYFLLLLYKMQKLRLNEDQKSLIKKFLYLYPIFLKRLKERLNYFQDFAQMNHDDQKRIDELTNLKNYCIKEIKTIAKRIQKRNRDTLNGHVNFDQENQLKLNPTGLDNSGFIDAEIID